MMNLMNLAYYLTRKIIWLSSLMAVIALSGCVSISKGVTLALLEKSEEPDTRKCEGWGKPFEGIEPRLAKERGKTKILMVHGVADHIPGYTTQFQGKLAKELGLNARSAKSKNIKLESVLFPGTGAWQFARVAPCKSGQWQGSAIL